MPFTSVTRGGLSSAFGGSRWGTGTPPKISFGQTGPQGGSQREAFPFIQQFANAPTGGLTPQQRASAQFAAVTGQGGGAIQNPFALASQLAGPGGQGFNPLRTLQEAQAASALQAAQLPLLQFQADPLRQGARDVVQEALEGPPAFMTESIRAGEQAALQQLNDARAAGRVSDVEFRQQTRAIKDQSRRNVTQLSSASRLQASQQASQLAAQQADITQRGVGGIIDVLRQIMRGPSPDASNQQQRGLLMAASAGQPGQIANQPSFGRKLLTFG